MPADQTTQLSLAQLFDTLPDAVLYMGAVRDAEHQQIVDFVIEYANATAYKNGRAQYPITIGESVLHTYSNQKTVAQALLAQLKSVVETGQPSEFEYYNEKMGEWLSVTRSKAGDGVLAIVRFITAGKQAALASEQRQTLLNSILNTSLNVTFVYEAIRNETGQIQDFRVLLVNEQGRRDVRARTGVDPLGNTLLGINPNSRQTGQFNLFCQVIESGEPVQVEQFYPDAQQVWYSTAVTKLNDGVVVTGIDITETKRATLDAEQARTDLQSVIDSSQTGIFVFSPIYDETGSLTDFRFKTINRMVAALVGQTPEVVRGHAASDWFFSYRETDSFNHFKHTLETGEDRRFDLHYNVDGFDVWFDVQAIKFGDDVLITFTNYTDLKQAQLGIERQTELLRSVLDSSNSGIMAFESIRDEQGTIIDFHFTTANEASEKLVGMSMETMRGNKLLTLFPGNVETGLFALYVNTTETGEPSRTEVYYNLDGLDFWLDISAQKLGDGFVVTFTDVSIVKRAQQTVERQAGLLRSVLDSSINGIMALTSVRETQDGVPGPGRIVDFRIVSANESASRMTGKKMDELVGQLANSVFEGNVKSGLFDKYVHTVETGEATRTETYYTYDGLDFWVDISAEKLSDGFVITFTDTSMQKRAAQLIKKSAAELQTVIDTSQTGIFLFSPVRDRSDGTEPGDVIDFRFRVANRKLAAYVDQEPEAVIGTLGSRWFPDYKTNGLFEAYRETYLTGQSQRFDIHYNGGGVDAWLDMMSTKLGDEVLVTFGDYTPLKKLQQELETSIVELQRSNANLEQFAYVASHDLQEPLRKIQAFGDIIEKKYGPVIGEQGADMIQRMQSAAARMQVLIKDVLAYSQIATKREAIRLVDLSEIATNVVDDLETAITDHKATVTIDELPTVVGDPGQLRQLFQNLLSNALKFMKPPTTLDGADTKKQSNPLITVIARTLKGNQAGMAVMPGDADRLFHLIEISDNGIGFDPHQAERIFQVFQRLHNRTVYEGTGIGLAIVKKVVENHNGYIQAVGRPGQGATFRILLPM